MSLITVIGPGDEASPQALADAAAVGRELAAAGYAVVTGGRHAGVMHAAASGAHAAGGRTIGILPGANDQEASPALDVAIPTGLGEARDAIVALAGRAAVVCGMSAGTAAEAALACKAGRPLLFVRPSKETLAFFRALAPRLVHAVPDAASVVPLLRELLASAGDRR